LPPGGGVAGGAQEELASVLQLSDNEPGGEVQALDAVSVQVMLRDPQVRVATLRADDPGEKAAGAGQPGDRPAVPRAAVDEVVGDRDPTEGDDVIDPRQWEQPASGLLGVVDPDGVPIQVQAGAGRCGVQGVEEVMHPTTPVLSVRIGGWAGSL
jgi:hypothetical protein